jgi:hypothetical protein
MRRAPRVYCFDDMSERGVCATAGVGGAVQAVASVVGELAKYVEVCHVKRSSKRVEWRVGLMGDRGEVEDGMKLVRSVRSTSWMSGGRVGVGRLPGMRAVGMCGLLGLTKGWVGLR